MSELPFEEELPTDPKELQRLVQELARKQTAESRFSASDEYKKLLRTGYHQLVRNSGSRFDPGQLVRWKPGLANRTIPDKDSVAIVVEHREDPLFGERDSGSPFFQEPLDLALAVITGEDRNFFVFWFDARRFEAAE